MVGMGDKKPKLRIKNPNAQLCLGYKNPNIKIKILGMKWNFWLRVSFTEKTKYLAKKREKISQMEVSIWNTNNVSSLTPKIRNKNATI